MFELTPNKKSGVVATCDRLAKLKYSKALPTAFTEHGAIMATSVLDSRRAVEMSVFVVGAFVNMRSESSDSSVKLIGPAVSARAEHGPRRAARR